MIRQHEHTEYPVNDAGVTLTDSGDEMKTVIAGGAAGASTGARLRRLDEPAEIVVLERDRYLSFANCGLPYHIGGAIPDRGSLLLQTPGSPRDLRLSHAPGEQPLGGPGPVHPAFGQGPGGGLGRDRHPLPPPARYLPGQWPGAEPNVLRVGLTEPYMRLSGTLNGPERTARIRQLEARSTPPRFTACAHLIRDMLNSNPMLFIRGGEAEEAWRIIDPVMSARTAGDVPMQEYPAGQQDHAVGAPEGTIPGTGEVSEDRRGGR